MLRFVALSDKHPIFSVVLRYGIAIASSAVAFTVVFLLQHIQVRDPYGLIFLAAIAVSFWYGGDGSGILAVILSTLALNVFLHSPIGWVYIAPYDLPLFCVYFLFAFWIYKFTRSRHRAQLLSWQARDH